jgi:all-trans-retinol dehydrogenase (NAD+)
MNYYANKRVLITGGASGIGRLLALKIAATGARTAICDIDAAGMEKVRSDAAAKGLSLLCFPVDLSRREQIGLLAAEVREQLGGVDILVNNAGIVSGKTFLECSDTEIERSLAVNLAAHIWLIRAFLPGMIERGAGHLVTVASAAGIVGVSRLADYSASKFACFGLDEALRSEFRKRRLPIRTTVVCPYFIDTGMFAGVKTRFSFLLPILKQERVAARIFKAVARRRSRLLMPPLVYAVWLLRLLPVRWFDFIADLLGINRAMDGFQGRSAHE